jgi:2-isopropylmalate synthase
VSTETIQLYDATLRDGMQGEGMSLSAEEKLRVAHAIDQLGVPLIEAGFPESNPKERELFDLLASEHFENAEIAAFGMTRRRDIAAADDPALVLLADSIVPVCTIVGKTWRLHLEKLVKVEPSENLRMIGESVGFLRAAGKRVIYDAEHYFDAWRADPAYAIACLEAAAEGGAETIVLCDTNGSSLPSQVAAATSAAVAALGGRVCVGIHCHNDAECGVANTLAAVEVGARQVQGTINGIGERTGNANLISIIANLQLKLGFDCVPEAQLARLTQTAHFVDELLNVPSDPSQPYVGRRAFAHKGGMHVAGVSAETRLYEHVEPGVVGNERELVVSELAGRASMQEKLEDLGLELDGPAVAQVLEQVKQLEHEGYQFEAADGSLELLLRRASGDYEPLFELESWRVVVESDASGEATTEATIRIRLAGRSYERSASGNGPVNALDAALRAAIVEVHPHLREIELVNYKVRILDAAKGTGAVTRVLIDASDGTEVWGTIGVSENVIVASWQALVDSLECGMLPSHVK